MPIKKGLLQPSTKFNSNSSFITRDLNKIMLKIILIQTIYQNEKNVPTL